MGALKLAVALAFVAGLAAVKAPAVATGQSAGLDGLIAACAVEYRLPEAFLRRVIKRESNFNPKVQHRGQWGLMQISHATARSMGYRGPASGLLDPETNLKYAGKYLAGAYLVAEGDEDRAIRLYSRGYYYVAKRKGLLEAIGLKPKRKK